MGCVFVRGKRRSNRHEKQYQTQNSTGIWFSVASKRPPRPPQEAHKWPPCGRSCRHGRCFRKGEAEKQASKTPPYNANQNWHLVFQWPQRDLQGLPRRLRKGPFVVDYVAMSVLFGRERKRSKREGNQRKTQISPDILCFGGIDRSSFFKSSGASPSAPHRLRSVRHSVEHI